MTGVDPDTIHRTALLGVYDPAHSTLEAAVRAHAKTGITVRGDARACRTAGGQAAVLTAVATATRAFGHVLVALDDPDAVVHLGPRRGVTLNTAVRAEGAECDDHTGDPKWPELLIGTGTAAARGNTVDHITVRATWAGWLAKVQPATEGPALDCDGDCVLAPIAAGALGVHEAFEGAVRAVPGSEAGRREVMVNLWRPGETSELGPALTYSAAAWWLLGLGHLGQAYGWVLTWLPYKSPAGIPIVLQDVDLTTPSTRSTGILTGTGATDVRKTRIVKRQLQAAGFDPILIERRYHGDLRIQPDDFHVALIGVDNLPTRRLISRAGWTLAIDVGLGTRPADYSALLLRRFPGSVSSDGVAAWRDEAASTVLPDTPAFSDLEERDACGAITLAGKAVGVCFVGVIAACHAIAEAVRELHGGIGHDALTLNLHTTELRLAPAATQANVLSERLATN